MKIAVAADHAGFKKKQKLVIYLTKKGHEVIDCGTDSIESTDYPTYAFAVGKKVKKKEADFGILICKTGIGMSIAANKVKGIRCAKVDTTSEAKLAKSHNHANVLAFGSDNYTLAQIKDMISAYMKASCSEEPRHLKRVSMIDHYGGRK